MKVLVLANDEQKEELLALPVNGSVTIHWSDGSIPGEYIWRNGCLHRPFV